jgi:hypothetical protein
MKDFEYLNHHQQFENWICGVLSGYREYITAMLLTMLPQATDLRLFAYATSAMALPHSEILQVLFGVRLRHIISWDPQKIFEPRLNKVKRLSILREGIDLLILRFDALEILKVNLVAEWTRVHNSTTLATMSVIMACSMVPQHLVYTH